MIIAVLVANIKPIMTTYSLAYTYIKFQDCGIWGSHSGGAQDSCFVGSDTVSAGRQLPTFRTQSSSPRRATWTAGPRKWRHCDVWKGGNYLPGNTVSHPRGCTFNRNIHPKGLSSYRCYPTSGVEKGHVYPAAQVAQTHAKYFSLFIWSWILSADRRQYSGSPLRGLEVILQITIGGRSVICLCPRLKTSSTYEHDIHSVSPVIGISNAHT
jgi:hypothetical protein